MIIIEELRVTSQQLYDKQHKIVKKIRGNASEYQCFVCGDDARDWALLHGLDGDDPDDYVELCRPCHCDYDREGRMEVQVRGSDHGRSVLTEEKVIVIRTRYASSSISMRKLAIEYKVSTNCIKQIIRRISWRHI